MVIHAGSRNYSGKLDGVVPSDDRHSACEVVGIALTGFPSRYCIDDGVTSMFVAKRTEEGEERTGGTFVEVELRETIGDNQSPLCRQHGGDRRSQAALRPSQFAYQRRWNLGRHRKTGAIEAKVTVSDAETRHHPKISSFRDGASRRWAGRRHPSLITQRRVVEIFFGGSMTRGRDEAVAPPVWSGG